MRKVLFSFLGTGEYEPCVYTYEGKQATESRFIQTAIYELFSEENLEIVLFTTPQAKEQNWENRIGQKGNELEGLNNAQKRIIPDAKIKLVEISSAQNEEANWQLFDKILEEIQEGDEIYFDMTHSFRSIPIISLIVLNYARFVKNATIKSLIYGLFQQNGPSPIVDMTNMLALLDWTNGVDQFIRTGDASLIKEITNKEVGKVQKNQNVPEEEKRNVTTLNRLASQLEKVGKSFQTCRSFHITNEIKLLEERVNEVGNISSSNLKPLQPLVNKINDKYNDFTDNETINGLLAAKWCEEHGLIQPALTLLQENVITTICRAFQLKDSDRSNRLLVSKAIRFLQQNLPEEKWILSDSEKNFVRDIVEKLQPYKKLLSSFDGITDYRNDINHAGANEENISPERIQSKLKKYIEDLTPFFEEMDKVIKKG